MAFERGNFGIEYDPRQREEPSGVIGWVVAVVALLAFVSLAWTLANRYFSKDDPQIDEPPPVVETPDAPAPPPPAVRADTAQRVTAPPAPVEPPAPNIGDTSKRPVKLRNLLMRLEEAKKRKDVEMEVQTIEQIRALPGSPAADFDDSLAKRLGVLNIRRLFNMRNAQWVKQVTVKRGDVASRIASENGSTLASFARLNGGDVNKVVIGKKLYVMDHPRFSLVIHRRAGTADLSLNGKFFKRYYMQRETSGKDGTYEFPANPKAFWRSLGVELKVADQEEIETLMPAKASVIVAEL